MGNLQKIGGIAALSEAVIYISTFIFFGAIWAFLLIVVLCRSLLFLMRIKLFYLS